LSGEITPQGAKNEALQILCAVLLTEDEVRITNIPDIKDVNKLIEILQDFNVKVTKNGKGDYTFKADEVNFDYIKSKEFKKDGAKLRGSVMMMVQCWRDLVKLICQLLVEIKSEEDVWIRISRVL
jgi:UDP-N-acetylglucosamine 1-carboxyvinyltransferase